MSGESGHEPPSLRTLQDACGFIVSAVRYRASDLAVVAWIPVDAVLRSRMWSNTFVLMPTALAAYLV